MSRSPLFRFLNAKACNMCGAPSEQFRLMGRRLDRHQGLRPGRRSGVAVTVVRCPVCGLVFPDPQPLPNSVEDLYDLDPEEYWNTDYFQVSPDYFSGEIARARTLLGQDGAPRALDIGAGLGKAMVALTQAGFDTWGLEPSAKFRQAAVDRMGIPADRIVLGGVEGAEFPAGHFDFITFGAVLEHLADPFGALAAASRWLRPGGVIHVEVPQARWLLARLLNLFYRLTLQGFVTSTSPMHPPFHLFEFTQTSFQKAGSRLGLEVAHMEVFVADVYAPGPLRPPLRWWMGRTGTGMQLAAWLRR